MSTYTVWVVDRDPSRFADGSRLPLFWRNEDGWVFRLAYRLWLVKKGA